MPVALPLYKSLELNEYKTNEIVPFEVYNDRVNISIYERTYDKKYDLLRLYESNGNEEKVSIKLNKYKEAYVSNLNEEKLVKIKIVDSQIHFTIKPNSVFTLLLR